MHFFPILATLRRHRTTALLIVLEIALTCAIVCNALFLIGDRLTRMDRPSGLVEDEILRVRLTGIGTKTDAKAVTVQDLSALRAIPGVKFVANVNMVPYGGSSWNSDVSTLPDDPNGTNAGLYMGSQDLLETFGVQLIAGRDFTPEEYVDIDDAQGKTPVPSVIITRTIADQLYAGKSAVGQKLYVTGKEPQTIVGVIDLIARPNEGGGGRHVNVAGFSVILPILVPFSTGGNYLLRVEPSRRADVLTAVDAALNKVDPNRIILDRQSFEEVRKDHFKTDRAMAYLLTGVSLALLIITAFGVVGLASFWVRQRTRQIGVRRALGATRGDILRYFQLENLILTTAGIVVGMALAYAINLWLMQKYEVPRLSAVFLPAGALLLWLLGQVAVLGPALRASAIPPAIATRTV
jgi:putative ABC transport system permease protein